MLVFAGMGIGNDNSFSVRWGKEQYTVFSAPDFQTNQTCLRIFRKTGSDFKKIYQGTEDATWEAKPIPNFFGSRKDALILYLYEGSSPCLNYEIWAVRENKLVQVSRRDSLSRVRLEEEQKGCLRIWTGIRQKVIECVDGYIIWGYWIPPQKKGQKHVMISLNEAGEVSVPPEAAYGNLKIGIGESLVLVRVDFLPFTEKIEIIRKDKGSLVVEFLTPQEFRFPDGGEYEIFITPDIEGPQKGAKFSLKVQ